MAWKKQWKKGQDAEGSDADIAPAESETCPACTSAVDPEAENCTQCGAGLEYFREQAREAAALATDEPGAKSTGQPKR